MALSEKWSALTHVPLPPIREKQVTPPTLLKTALEALKNQDQALLIDCLDKGLSPNASRGKTTLMEWAIQKGSLEQIIYLRSQGASLEVDDEHPSPLAHALETDNLPLFQYLLKEGVTLKRTYQSPTPQIDFVLHIGHAAKIGKWLLNQGYHFELDNPPASSTSATSAYFQTYRILHWIRLGAKHWDEETLKTLDKQISKSHYKSNKQGAINILWDQLIDANHVHGLQKALQLNWTPDDKNPLLKALSENKRRVIEWLSQSPLLVEEARQEWKRQPFHFNLGDSFEKMVELRFDFSLKGNYGKNALHYLCELDLLTKKRIEFFLDHFPEMFEEKDDRQRKPFDILSEEQRQTWQVVKERLQLEKMAMSTGRRSHQVKSKRL